MAVEIERRFLVVGDGWRALAGPPQRIVQGYLAHGVGGNVVRIRKIGDETAVVTVKGPRHGPARAEFEYPIPAADADAMLDELCPGPLVEKDRYALSHAGRAWVVDVYLGAAAGTVIAEVDLADPDQPIRLPPWAGRDVTGDPAYSNHALAAHAASRRDRRAAETPLVH